MKSMEKLKATLRQALRDYGPASAALLALVGIWHLAVIGTGMKEFVLPTPVAVAKALVDPRQRWGLHLQVTTIEIMGAFALSAALGVALGAITVWNAWLERVIMPILVLFNTLPKIALAPLFVMWMGYGVVPNIVIAVTVAFFPVVIGTATGLARVEPELLELARVHRGSSWQVFRKLRFPTALPHIFAGLKVSASLAVVGAIVGEFVASDKGLGSVIIAAGVTLSTPVIFASLVLISGLGLALFALVAGLERLATPWEFRDTQKR